MAEPSAQEAARRIAGRVRRTPVLDLETGSGSPVVLKLEQLQLSGSFKIRGAMNRILADGGRHSRVVAASGGNHGVAVTETCRQLGLDVDVFVPATSPPGKLARMDELGARVHVIDASFTEVEARCQEFGREHDALFVHPFDDPEVMAGQGTLALEILDQVPDVRSVFVAVGGGGLAAGISQALPDHVELVAVEPEACPSLQAALAAGRPVGVPVGGVAADSLGAPLLGERAYEVLSHRVESVLSVTEEEIIAAQLALWDGARVVAEPAAAAAYAGYLKRADPGPGQVVIICGANIAWPWEEGHAAD